MAADPKQLKAAIKEVRWPCARGACLKWVRCVCRSNKLPALSGFGILGLQGDRSPAPYMVYVFCIFDFLYVQGGKKGVELAGCADMVSTNVFNYL